MKLEEDAEATTPKIEELRAPEPAQTIIPSAPAVDSEKKSSEAVAEEPPEPVEPEYIPVWPNFMNELDGRQKV